MLKGKLEFFKIIPGFFKYLTKALKLFFGFFFSRRHKAENTLSRKAFILLSCVEQEVVYPVAKNTTS